MPRRFRKPTKARPTRPRLRGAACRHPRRFLGRDQLRSVGSVRSQADEARRHAGGRTSGNGPDTTERAPLDARVWVPSVFRARPAIKMQECPLSLFRARTGRRRRRGPTRREEACAQRVYATNSLPRKSKKPSRGAPPACGPAAATRWTPGKGRGRRKRVPPAKTGSDEPRCTLASHNARSASGAAPSGTEPLEHTKDTIKQVRGPAPAQGTRAHSAG